MGEWSDPLQAAVLLAVAAVAVAATVMLTPATSPPTERLAGVLGAVAVAAVATGIWQLVAPVEGRVVTDTAGRELVVAVPTLAVAVVVYLRHHHVLTHAGLGTAAAATCVAVGDLLAGGASSDAQQTVAGAILVVAAVAWIVASETGRLPPAWLGTPAAGAVAYAGMAMAMSWSVWSGADHAALLANLVLAAAGTAVGVATGRLRVTVVGTVGLLVIVPMTFTEVLGWSGTATAAVLLPVGVAVTAWAVLASRTPAGPT